MRSPDHSTTTLLQITGQTTRLRSGQGTACARSVASCCWSAAYSLTQLFFFKKNKLVHRCKAAPQTLSLRALEYAPTLSSTVCDKHTYTGTHKKSQLQRFLCAHIIDPVVRERERERILYKSHSCAFLLGVFSAD
jgi:hypothetical protein